jgi:glycine/D-amino acid oxidase-like deaminating enzyme
MLDGSEARRIEPQLPADVVAALLLPDHGYAAASALTRALMGAATKHGASFTNCSAVAVRGGEPPEVDTSAGTLVADGVVIAAGSWSGLFAESSLRNGQAGGPIRPIRGQLLRLRLPTPPASRVIWGSRCYLVPRRDGTVLAGATVEDVGFDETATASAVQHLLGESVALLPILQHAAFEEVRVGLRPMTPDELPVIGASSTKRHVFYASGHYRNGILLAPLTAALMADLLLDGRERPELAIVRPDRLGL